MNKNYVNFSVSNFAVVLSLIIAMAIGSFHKYWQDERYLIESDVISYYAYLPATFVYQDLSLRYFDKLEPTIQSKIWFEETEDGGRVIKTTMGVAYLYLPFFVVATHLADFFDYTANGYTKPYQIAILCASLFYFLFGLIFIRKLLSKYISQWALFWTILIIGAGTNIVNYVTREPGMSHTFNFCLIAAFIYLLDRWVSTKGKKSYYLMALVLGLITLCRPINLLIGLLAVLYQCGSISAIKNRVIDLIKPIKRLIIAVILFLLPIIPQLLYWKYTSGNWLFFSYTDNEQFFFNDPKIIEGLFSYRKGWLLYTPLMALLFIGLIINRKTKLKYKLGIATFLIITVYISFSWWSWWYGGSFGMRPMIDFYAIFAIPIGVLIHQTFKLKFIPIKIGLVAVIFTLICYNQLQAYQYRVGLLHHSLENKETYWMHFLETERLNKEYYNKLSEIDYEAAKTGEGR